MTIWIMNIKDNRTNGSLASSGQKFDVCLQRGILAIGWVGYTINQSTSFQRAYNALDRMRQGDLVWVKHPVSGQRYICKITKDGIQVENNGNSPTHVDLGFYVECKYYPISNSDLAAFGIEPRRLVSISTARRSLKPDLNDMTTRLFATK